MKLLLLGATGRTGQLVLDEALYLGHEVTVLVRQANQVEPRGNLTIFEGNLMNKRELAEAMEGNEAVLTTLGNPSTNKGAALFERAIPIIIETMRLIGVKRFINLSAMGVGPTFKNAPIHYQIAAKTFLRGAFQDHWRGEQLLLESNLDWTLIHPGILTNQAKTDQPLVKEAKDEVRMPFNPKTSRADVAQVILSILTDASTYQKSLLLSSNH